MQNKIKLLCIGIIGIQLVLILYFYMGVLGLNRDLNTYAKMTNLLNIERDFEIYKALQEKDLTKIKKNLDLNIMFHLKPIETDKAQNLLPHQDLNRLCKVYKNIAKNFQKDYKNKYPLIIKELSILCKK